MLQPLSLLVHLRTCFQGLLTSAPSAPRLPWLQGEPRHHADVRQARGVAAQAPHSTGASDGEAALSCSGVPRICAEQYILDGLVLTVPTFLSGVGALLSCTGVRRQGRGAMEDRSSQLDVGCVPRCSARREEEGCTHGAQGGGARPYACSAHTACRPHLGCVRCTLQPSTVELRRATAQVAGCAAGRGQAHAGHGEAAWFAPACTAALCCKLFPGPALSAPARYPSLPA